MTPEPMVYTGSPTILFQFANQLGLDGFKIVGIAMAGPPDENGQVTCQFMVLKNNSNERSDYPDADCMW